MKNTKQFKDVAHHYIGCEIEYPTTSWNGRSKKQRAILTGVNRDGLETTWKRRRKSGNSWCVGDYLSWKPNGNHNTDALHVKPILRDLADMLPDFYDRTPSDEEDATADRIWETLWAIVFPDSKEDRSCGVFEQKQNGMWMLRYGSERLFLHECGEMFATDVNGPIPFNAAAVVHFLTSEGFDIFGLIKSRQATRKPIPKT